jgi:hypothetical protein
MRSARASTPDSRRLFLTLAATVFVVLVLVACWINLTTPRVVDFARFWHVAGLVLRREAAEAYAVQSALVGHALPFGYPPPFLFVVAPFGLIGFGLAFLVWVIVTGLLYVLASPAPARLSLANPPAAFNGLIGQNGFLTASIMLFGARCLEARPILGGAILGLMVIKPQLAVLVPLALIAGRQWLAILGAVMSSFTMLAVAALVFGIDAYRGFLEAMPQYASMLDRGTWSWNELASTFAFMRWFGASESISWTVHAVVALLGAAMLWGAWRQDWDCKVPVLASAALLISPYIFTYDAVLLIAPLSWLALRKPVWAGAVWVLSLLPLGTAFGIYDGPNSIPLAVTVSLASLWFAHGIQPSGQPRSESAMSSVAPVMTV